MVSIKLSRLVPFFISKGYLDWTELKYYLDKDKATEFDVCRFVLRVRNGPLLMLLNLILNKREGGQPPLPFNGNSRS